MSKGSILITGGTGYIGSHTCIALINAGYHVIILDNLINSYVTVLDGLSKIVGFTPHFILGDVRDRSLLNKIFTDNSICAVIHFAGHKVVGESIQRPLAYYDNNIHGTMSVLSAMEEAGVRTFIFSSSASVYGESNIMPQTENSPCVPSNPYSRSKLYMEEILSDLYQAKPEWQIACLRYFNPSGAHPSGLIGEHPRGIAHNIMPNLAKVAMGREKIFNIYGGDYSTLDGTGVRDYIHVMDLAKGHLSALQYFQEKSGKMLTLNLGIGQGLSVLQVIYAFEQASGKEISYKILPRRPGDVAQCWADPSLAHRILGWRATYEIAQICEDAWRWQQYIQENI